MAHWLKVRQKQSGFNTQNIPISGASADDAASAVFRDTLLSTDAKQQLPDTDISVCQAVHLAQVGSEYRKITITNLNI